MAYRAYSPAVKGISLYKYSPDSSTSTTIHIHHCSMYFFASAHSPMKLRALLELSHTGTVELVYGGEYQPAWVTCDGNFFLLFLLLSEFPIKEPIEGCQCVVDLHAEVSIQSGFVIDEHIDDRHDDACQPEPDTCLVFLIDVNKADKAAEHV